MVSTRYESNRETEGARALEMYMEAPHSRTDEPMRGWETPGLRKKQEKEQVGKSWGHSGLGRICAPSS